MKWEYKEGMSLLDIFALEAMKLIVNEKSLRDDDMLAFKIYKFVKNMLIERKRILSELGGDETDNG